MPIGHSRCRRLLDGFFLLVVATACVCAACSSPTPPTPVFGVTAISPTVGSTTGGTTVTITGTELTGDITVTVGGEPATNVVLQGSTSVTAVVARSTPGTVDVVVTSAGRTATLPSAFAFVAPSDANPPPAINSIRSTGPYHNQPSGFADLDQVVTLVATVTDNETPADALTYQWTGPGVFSGSSPTVEWHLPATLSPTPSPVTATLTVTETFTEGKLTHSISAAKSFVMDVHDSQKEILDMGQDFLTLFSQSQIPTKDVLHNFSPTCDNGFGRSDEEKDVDENRAKYVEDFGAFRVSRRGPATIAFRGFCSLPDGRLQLNVDACSSFAVHWEVTKKSTGAKSVSEGVDYISAVLENSQWRLCHSSFIPSAGFPTLGLR